MSQPTLQRDRQGVDYGEEQNVQELHAAGQPEKRDGRITIKPFSLWVLIVLGFVFFFAGFFSARRGADFSGTAVGRGNPPPVQSTQAVETGTASATAVQSTVADSNAPVVAHVAMKNMKFSPATIEIKKGDTVEWTNEDITPHTATAIPSFDSGSIASDQTWRHTFNEAGDFPYSCTFHPEMKGDLIVK